MTSPAVVDLLGLLAYGELASFGHMAADAQNAPSLYDKAQMSKFATVEHDNYNSICARLTALGVDPITAMQPFSTALDAYHAQLIPSRTFLYLPDLKAIAYAKGYEIARANNVAIKA